MNNKNFFSYDRGSVSVDMLLTMHPAIVAMISWSNLWCYSHGIFPHWTSWKRTPEQNRALGATDVHEYRAADLSLKKEHGWTHIKRQRFQADFNERFRNLGAITKNKAGSWIRRPIIRHDVGHGDHFHLQCSPHARVHDEYGFDYTIKTQPNNPGNRNAISPPTRKKNEQNKTS